MKVFVSSPRVGQAGSPTDALIAQLRAHGVQVSHSPPDRSNVSCDDPRLVAWRDWYDGGCAAAVSAADSFVAVVDNAYTSSTWMGLELEAAQSPAGSRTRPLRMCWYESALAGGARYLPAWWAAALGDRLPDDVTTAVEVLVAAGDSGEHLGAAT